MSYANQVNFLPNPNYSGYYGPAGNCIHGNCYGHGAPSDSFGSEGSTYIDLDGGDFYVKYGDTWVIQGAGGGGAGLTYSQGAALDPNGSVSGATGDVYHSRVSLGGDGSTWWKTTASGNTGWE